MNKTAIRNYAVWARTALIEAVTQKAFEYEIKEGQEMVAALDSIDGRLLSANEKEWRRNLIDEIKRKSFTQVMEEVAYTWFNRFIALRYMEVNSFIPSRVRVFTNENGEFKPDILKEAMTVEIDGIDRAKVIDLLEKQNNEELFKYLIITQCNALNQGLPYMFEKISNWTELLFPANLLRSDSIIGRMVNDIPEEDFKDEVEIIGWLYQFYITEKHEEVIDPLHGKTIKKEDIPAATQLFTTDWVVRYILDNSLGRYWIERHPESQLASKLTYLVTPKDGSIETVNETISPEGLKVLDPCVGSGHFLSYAFEHFELDEPLKERIVTMIEYLEGIHMDISGKFHDEANQVVDLILDQIRKYTGINIKYGLWLTSIDAIKSIYSFSIGDSMEVYRYEPGLIISDVGFDFPANIEQMSRNLAHAHPSGTSKGISSSIHFTVPSENFS